MVKNTSQFLGGPRRLLSSTDTDTRTAVLEDSSSRIEEQTESESSEYSLSPEHYQDFEEDLPSLPPSPPTHPLTFYPTMSDTLVTSSLHKAAKIKKLNGPDD